MSHCVPDPVTLPIHIAQYLHAQGVTQNVMDPQEDGDLPGVFVGQMADTPNRAVSIIGPWSSEEDSDHSTPARFMVAIRSEPWDIIGHAEDCETIHNLLERDEQFPLTATQHVMFCHRVVSDPPVQDNNRRWVRVSTYQTRLHPPS